MIYIIITKGIYITTLISPYPPSPPKLPACTTASRTTVATIATNSSANRKFVWLNPSWWYWVLTMLHNQDYQNPNIKSHSLRFLLRKPVSVSCKVVQRMYTGNSFVLGISPVIACELTAAVQIRFNSAGDNVMWSTVIHWTVTQILVPPLCTIATSQLSNHVLQAMFTWHRCLACWLCLHLKIRK